MDNQSGIHNPKIENVISPQKASDIDIRGLEPRTFTMPRGGRLELFNDDHIELVKIDFAFEAGTAYQDKKFQAVAALNLLVDGSENYSAQQIAEFIDYRGIIIEKNVDTVSACMTVYTLVRYVDELMPVLYDMITKPLYSEKDFNIFIEKRRHQLKSNFQRTSYVARNLFNEALYGPAHPIGSYAVVDDIDKLTVEDVRRFFKERYSLSQARIVVSGGINDDVINSIQSYFDTAYYGDRSEMTLPAPSPIQTNGFLFSPMEAAAQNTLRVGRLLPMVWDSTEYVDFMVLTTILGGYFGSRLMSNIREDKGYTYGINALTNIFRGSISFFIVSDVAADKADAALKEIMFEIERLRNEPVSDDELRMVRNVMLGDFLRSIDGIFERSERFRQMKESHVTERFTDVFLEVLSEDSPYAVTPERLQSLAQRVLDPKCLLQVSVGREHK